MCTFISRPGALLSTLWLALLFNQCLARVSNRTIDDVFGDPVTGQLPVFLPENLGVWKDQTCGDCSINPDKGLARNGTYHSATYNPDLKSVNVTMNFDGTAIYVFLILANNAGPGITTETNCAFKLDGTTVGNFHHIPSTSTDLQYNVLAFSKADIPPGNHHFVIATEGITTNSYLNFDYALYTHEDDTTSTIPRSSSATSHLSSTPSTSPPQSSTNNQVPAGVIAGSVIGGVACLAAIGACIFFNRHQRRPNIKRINPLGDPDSDTPITTTTASRRRPPPLLLSQSNIISTFPVTGAPSNSSARPKHLKSIGLPTYHPTITHPTSNILPTYLETQTSEEVSFLQAQQLSPWIRDANLEPPPDYTTAQRRDEWSSRPVNV